jgi:uncharacterized protein (TIGR03435 family)
MIESFTARIGGRRPRIRLSLIAVSLCILFSAFPAAAQSNNRAQPGKELKFEVLSIRPTRLAPGAMQGISNPTPNGFTTTASLWQLVVFAFGPPVPAWMWTSVKIANQPSWLAEEYYTVDARVSQADLKAWQSQSTDQELLRSALRAVLRERCKLAIHEQPSQERNYELVVANGGSRLKATVPGSPLPAGVKLQSGAVLTYGNGAQRKDDWQFHGATMQDLAHNLGLVSAGVPVRDRTGLSGRFDFSVRHQLGEEGVYSYPVDHLGLRLKRGTENRPILVIDHVERPTPN